MTVDEIAVLRWDDLAEVYSGLPDSDVCLGHDLLDRAGNVFISGSVNSRKFRPILQHAEQVLAERRGLAG